MLFLRMARCATLGQGFAEVVTEPCWRDAGNDKMETRCEPTPSIRGGPGIGQSSDSAGRPPAADWRDPLSTEITP
jgi:hypothetical protein